ncbi:MAG: helix-turn-helix domain-containing protein [Mycobacterium sp.]
MTLDDLGGRLFADVPQTASILGLDERTVRKAAASGEIPAEKIGNKWMIRAAWLRGQAGNGTSAAPDLDELADRVADRVFDRALALFARLFGDRAGAEPGETA